MRRRRKKNEVTKTDLGQEIAYVMGIIKSVEDDLKEIQDFLYGLIRAITKIRHVLMGLRRHVKIAYIRELQKERREVVMKLLENSR